MIDFDDQPITTPDADLFGFDEFARVIAQSIARLKSVNGSVLAINGPWGSGKSSVVNLVKHHLSEESGSADLVVLDFRCWWFRGEEALAVAFFRDLYAKVGASLGAQFKKSFRKVASRILKAGSTVSAGADLVGASGAGSLAAGAMDWLSGFCDESETVDELYQQIVSILEAQDKRFLIVVDDIDRLTPDEAVQMFRLVKSVGKLPNVIYLLVYDRKLAEATVSQAFPSEGPHFLEKIVQASFDVPMLDGPELSGHLLNRLATIMGTADVIQSVDFMNIFYDIVDPLIRRPRDMVKLCNHIGLVWPAIGSNVFAADMLAIETIRLFKFDLYLVLRENKELLCPSSRLGLHHDMIKLRRRYDNTFLKNLDDEEADLWRSRLTRLFPRLKEVWNSSFMGDDYDTEWSVGRRVCSPEHFGTYFRLALGPAVLSQAEIEEILSTLAEPDVLRTKLRTGLLEFRSNGMTKSSLILDVLNQQALKINLSDAEVLLTTVFNLADELDVEADKARGFSIGDNILRVHWLLRRLLFERTSLEERSAILMRAAKSAALGWADSLHWSAYENYHPREDKPPASEDKCLLIDADVEALGEEVKARIAKAANDGSLINNPLLDHLLVSWSRHEGDDFTKIKKWTSAQLVYDESVAKFAAAFITYSWSQTSEDTVTRRAARVDLDFLGKLFDLNDLHSRAAEVSSSSHTSDSDRQVIMEFLGAWKRAEDKSDRL